MNSNYYYPSSDHVIRIHSHIMEITNQVNEGLRPDKYVKQTTDFVQIDDYYPDIFSKLSYYLFSFSKNHYFKDGNKRVALGVIKLFMVLNGIHVSSMFLDTIEAVIMMTASTEIDNKEFLQRYLEMILTGISDETVQLEIYRYLSNSD